MLITISRFAPLSIWQWEVVVTLHFILVKTCNLLISDPSFHIVTHKFYFVFMLICPCANFSHKHVFLLFTPFFASVISLTSCWSSESHVHFCCLICAAWMVQVLPQKRLTTHACHFPRTLKSNMLRYMIRLLCIWVNSQHPCFLMMKLESNNVFRRSCGASSMLPSMMRCSPSAAPRNLEFGICECSQLFGTVETWC